MQNDILAQLERLAEAQGRYNALVKELRDNNIPAVRQKAQEALAALFAGQPDCAVLLAEFKRLKRIEEAAKLAMAVPDHPLRAKMKFILDAALKEKADGNEKTE